MVDGLAVTNLSQPTYQYYEGCGAGHNGSLLFAHVALNRTASFLRNLAQRGGSAPFERTGVPHTLLHYEYPQGHDTASGVAYARPGERAP